MKKQTRIYFKQIVIFFLLLQTMLPVQAQKETYDLVTYSLPKDSAGISWKKETSETVISYTAINKTTGGWCRIAIVKSTISKGTIEQDFDSEWEQLILKNYKLTGSPQLNDVVETDGWRSKAGGTKFTFNNADAIAMLTTFSGYGRCASIVATTNSEEFLKQVAILLTSINLNKPPDLQ